MIVYGLQFERIKMSYDVMFSISTVLKGRKNNKLGMLFVPHDLVDHKLYFKYQQN